MYQPFRDNENLRYVIDLTPTKWLSVDSSTYVKVLAHL